MQVIVTNTDYSDKDNIRDVPSEEFLASRNPLYIGGRVGQVKRMRKNIKQDKLGGIAVGFWELKGNPGYITKRGTVNWDQLQNHDVVFISSSDRVEKDVRAAYQRFLDTLCSQTNN